MSKDLSQSSMRTTLREARRSISCDQREELSQALCSQLKQLDYLVSASLVSSFISLPEEINTAYVNTYLLQQGVKVYLPVIIERGKPLAFAPYDNETKMIKGEMDIPIPDVSKSAYIEGCELDICLTPLVGFDLSGNRIGMGGGYYDKTFQFLKTSERNKASTKLIGVAYDLQQLDAIAQNEWDVKLDELLTPSQHYVFQ